MAYELGYGFRPEYRLNGLREFPTQSIVTADAALKEGDVVNLESGELDLAVASDTAIIGVAAETRSGMTTSTDEVLVYVDYGDVVWSVFDQNARTIGDVLDISGTTGAMTVTTKSSDNLVVVATKDNANDRTLVRFILDCIFHGKTHT